MIEWKGVQVLITGGSGLLGRSLISILKNAGIRPFVLSRGEADEFQGCHVIRGQIEELEQVTGILADHAFDFVFHLAAQSQVNNHSPLNTFRSNILGTVNLLELVRKHHSSATVVLASTVAASRLEESVKFPDEAAVLGPYVASKLSAELICRCYCDTYNVRIGVARLTNVYGPSDRNTNRLVPGAIHSILQGKQPHIRSNPKNLINCLFVDDVSQALLLFADHIRQQDLRCEVVDICASQECTLQALVDLIIRKMEATDMSRIPPTDEPFATVTVNKASALLGDDLGWKPAVNFEDGMNKTIKWYQTNVKV